MKDVEETLVFIRDKAKEHAEALAQRDFLKEFRKSKKAMLIIQAEQQGVTGGQQGREAYAYAHPDYIELLEGLKVATEREANHRHLIKASELRIEVWRSQNARAKAEINAYNTR